MASERGGRNVDPASKTVADQYPAITWDSKPSTGPLWYNEAALKAVLARESWKYQVQAQADVMSTEDLAMVTKWAAMAPTVDIRTAASLAFSGIDPLSPEGGDVAIADVAARVRDESYANGVDIPGNGMTRGAEPAEVAKPDDHEIEPEDSWWQTLADNVVPDPNNEFWDNLMPDPGTTASNALGLENLGTPQLASRWALTVGQSALDFIEGGARLGFGEQSRQSDIADKYKLTPEERTTVLSLVDPDPSIVVQQLSEFPPDRRAVMEQALAEVKEGALPQDSLPQIMPQTAIGQAIEDPDVIAKDAGSWLPSATIEERKEVKALEAFDIRTAEEILRGVEPTAWTPGRGIAHVKWSADEEAFHTWSGVVDFAKSVTLDPVNYVPMGAAGKIGTAALALNKGSKAALRAAIASEDKVVAVTDTMAAQGAAASRRGAANVAAAKADGAGYVTDTIFQNRNVTILDDGRVTGPYGQYLVAKQAWAWLNSGKGQRVTDDLAGRTSAYDIWKRSGGDRGGMSWELADQLANAKTPAAVRAILGSRIGAEIDDAGMLTKFGQSPIRMKIVDSSVTSRVGKTMARQLATAARGNVISVHDSDTLVRELSAFATAAKLDHTVTAEAIDKIMAATNGAERYEAIYEGFFSTTIKNHLVQNLGIDDADADLVTKAYRGGLDNTQRELWNKGIAYGGGPSTGFPTLMGENLSDLVQLPSYRELLRISSGVRDLRKKLIPGNDEAIGDWLQDRTSDWRNLVLFRPAYTLREVGEMSFSMALSGYSSAFTHPFQAIAMATHVAALNASKTAAGDLLKAMASGKADPKVRAQLRNDVYNAHVKLMAGETVSASGRYAKYAVQKGIYEASAIPMKAFNAVLHLRGLQQLAPYIDPTMARVNGDSMLAELVRYQETGDRTHLSSIADAMAVTHGNFIQDQASKTFGETLEGVKRPDLGDGSRARDYASSIANRLRVGSEDPEVRNIAQTSVDPNWTMADVEAAYVAGTKSQKHTMFRNSKGYEEWADPAIRSDLDYLTAQEETLRALTGADPELLAAVAKGKYNGKEIGSDNAEFVDLVAKVIKDRPDTFPEEVGVLSQRSSVMQHFDRVTSDFFQNTAAFSDVFARGPIVRQAYVKRVLELGHQLSPAAKAEVVANLRAAGDVKLAKKVQAIKATGGLTIDEVDGIAAGFARKEVQRIFYDASRRQNWALAMRVASPFAQATMNTFKRWGLMSVQNPQSYYRALKPLMALEQPGSAVLYDIIGGMTGDPTLEQYFDAAHPSLSPAGGFFFNDRYGEKKFAYPLVGPIAKLLGAPEGVVGLGSLENLNVAGTSFNPGFGPAVTLAASFGLNDVIDDKTFAGDVVRALWPYGLPEDEDGWVSKVIGATLPTAYKKAEQSLTADSPLRMNTAVATLSGLINSGDYDLSDSSEMSRLMNDADALSQRLGLWSALFGAVTPSTFSPSALVEIKTAEGQEGVARWIMVDRLMEEYQKYTRDDYQNGTLNFVNDFGATALFSALPRTKTDAIAQATNDMWQFRTDNPTSYEENIEVIGLFMSNDDLGSNFSRELFLRQRQEGTRGYMKLDGPGGYEEKANEALGWMLWNKGTATIDREAGDDENKRARLRKLLSEDLIARFPGFSPSAKDTGRDVELIAKIRDALDDPGVRSLPSAYYVDRYLRQRDAALNALMTTTEDVNSLSVKKASPVARQLWLLGQQYANEDTSGGFRHMWNRVLSQELDAYGKPANEEAK